MQAVANGLSEALGSTVRISLGLLGRKTQQEPEVNPRVARRIAELAEAPGRSRTARSVFRF